MSLISFTPDTGTKSSFTVSKTVSAGSAVLMWLSTNASAGTWTATGGAPADITRSETTSSQRTIRAWLFENVAAGTFSKTVSGSISPNGVLQAVEITGAATSGAFEATSSNDGNGSASVEASVAGINCSAGSTVITAFNFDRSCVLTEPGYTPDAASSFSDVFYVASHKVAGGALTGETGAGTLNTGAWYAAIIVSVKEAPPSSSMTGTVDVGDAGASGSMAGGAPSGLSGTMNDAGITDASGTLGIAPGSISWTVRNSANLPVAGVTIPVVSVCRINDGVQVLALTNLVTNGSGVALIANNASLAPGQFYAVSYWRPDGTKLGLPVILQAT